MVQKDSAKASSVAGSVNSDARERRKRPARQVWRVAFEGRGRIRVEASKLATPKFAEVELTRNATVGPYILLDPLEHGSGNVCRAVDPRLERKVALKFTRTATDASDDGGRAGLALAQRLARLSHPNIVSVLDVGESGARPFMAMDWVDAAEFDSWLSAAPRNWRSLVTIAWRLTQALLYMHGEGVCHGAIGNEHIRVDAAGRPTLIGFRSIDAPTPNSRARDLRDLCTTLNELVFERSDHRQQLRLEGRQPKGFAALIRLETMESCSLAELSQRLEAMHRAQRKNYRGWTGVAALGALLLSVALPLRPNTTPPGACSDPGQQWRGVWDDARRQQLRTALGATQLSYSAQTAELVEHSLDAYRKAWLADYAKICNQRSEDTSRSGQLDQRWSCLRTALDHTRALIDEFASADAGVAERAMLAVHDLPDTQHCPTLESNDDHGRELTAKLFDAVEAHLDDAEPQNSGESRDSTQSILAKVSALIRTGRYTAAHELARQWLDRARSHGDTRTVAEFAYALSRLGIERGDPRAQTSEYLHEAKHAAIANNMTVLAAEAASGLLFIDGYNQQNPTTTTELIRAAESHLAAAGSPAKLMGQFHQRVGILQHMAGQASLAEGSMRLGLQLIQSAFGREHPRVTTALSNLGYLLDSLGQTAEAVRLQESGLALRAKLVGSRHPTLSFGYSNLASAQIAAGMWQKSIESAHLSVARCSDAHLASSSVCIIRRQILSRALYNAGHWREAMRIAKAIDVDQRKLASRSVPERNWESLRLGQIAAELGDWATARAQLERSEASLAEDELARADHFVEYELLAARVEIAAGALRPAQRILARIEQRLPETRIGRPLWQIAEMDGHARLERARADFAKALEFHARALELGRALHGANNPNLTPLLLSRATTLTRAKRLDAARADLEAAARLHDADSRLPNDRRSEIATRLAALRDRSSM